MVPSLSRSQIFLGFLKIGLSGFGAALPWMRRFIVEQEKWLTENEFVEILGLCQVLPGPNLANATIVIGARYQGAVGALLAITGLMLAPITIVIGLGILYNHFGQFDLVRNACAAVAAAAGGLIIATGLKMSARQPKHIRFLLFGAMTFAAIGVMRLPLLPVLLILGPLSVLMAWWRQEQA